MQSALGLTKLVRVMPNIPTLIAEGMSIFFASSDVDKQEREWVKTLFSACGKCLEAKDEDAIDAATAISGAVLTYVYTPPASDDVDAAGAGGAARVAKMVVELEVRVLGKPVPGSPFSAALLGANAVGTDWQFKTISSALSLVEDGKRVIRGSAGVHPGAIADGPGCSPLTEGRHDWEIQPVQGDPRCWWYIGVCSPGACAETGFRDRADTWVLQCGNRTLHCATCKGTGITDRSPLATGERIGLLLDLDAGGSLTVYRGGKPCGSVAVGLIGPLLPCITTGEHNMSARIHGGLALPE